MVNFMRVDVEHVLALYEGLRKINKVKLEDIEWFKDGVKIEIDPIEVEHFRFVGLNNTDFVTLVLEDE